MKKLGQIRRASLVVLFVIAVFALAFAFAGCTSTSSSCAHDNTIEQIVDATCTEAGSRTEICIDCGEVISTTTIAALGHDYQTDSEQSVAATCTADGKTVEVCSRCGDTKETTVEKLGHSYEDTVTAATCTEQGYTTHTCANCGDSYVDSYTAASGSHNYDAVVTAATCIEQGYTTYTCKDCGYSYVADYVAAGDHAWTGSTCEGQTCSVCGTTIPATTAHNYTTTAAASCTESVTATYTCSICGDSYTETLLATGHTYATDTSGNVVWTLKTDSAKVEGTTCTYETVYYATCTTCGEQVESKTSSYIHTYVLKETSAATCSTAGTKEMVCSGCGAIQENTAVSFYAEHTYGDGTTSGDTTVYTCSVCNKTKTVYSGNSASVSTTTLASDVELGSGTVISMSDDAVSGLTSTDNLTLAADTLSDTDLQNAGLSSDDLNRVGDSSVYNITLSDGTDNITTFGGTVTVKLPYQLSEGEDETNITIFYLSDSGLEVIENAVYTSGYVVFETSHFSYYTVGKYTAAELCAKYGHNTKVLSKDATCLESGYYIEVCTRCNETIKSETYAALGHDFEQNITKVATCTENGTVVYTCKNEGCGASYSGVLAATGHSWTLDSTKSTEATCAAAGHSEYYCANCGATYSIGIAQLSHKYAAVVTAPTCTEVGYTTYTCTLCGDTYTADYIAANGHTFDSEAECIDRVCLVCGTTVSATAEHSYGTDGICTVCGYGCDHVYLATVVAATCTTDGYTKKVCSKCGATIISDYVAATGHTYTDDITKCDVCGEANPEMIEIFNTLIQNCYAYGYTLTLTDATFTMENDRVYYGYKYTYSCTVDAAELYISYEDGAIIIYGYGEVVANSRDYDEDGELTYDYEFTASAVIYGDGEYIYLYVYQTEGDDDEYSFIERASYEYVLGDYYDIIFADAEAIEQYNELIETCLEDELVQQWLAVMENNGELANQIAAEAFYTLFNSKATESGYEFTLDIDNLAELNENLYTLTVSELIDEYLGEGTYSSLGSYITSIKDKSLYAVVTDLLLYGEDYGVTSDLVYTTINTLVAMYTGEEGFDIESFLKDDSEETMVIGEMTIAELLAELAGIDDYSVITEMLEEYGKINIYTYLFDSALLEGQSEEIYTTIKNLASGDIISLVFTTDKNFAVTSINLVLNNAGYVHTEYLGSTVSGGTYDGNDVDTDEVDYAMAISVSGVLDVDYSCNLPEGYDSYKTQIESICTSIIDAIKAVCLASESGTVSVNYYSTFGVNSDGTVYYTYDRYGTQIVIADISKLENLMIRYDCTDTYYIYTSSDVDGYYTSLYLYIDVKNNKLSTESFHDYQVDNSLAPAGTPTSADEVDCEETYYTYYKCSICGEIKCVSNWKSHEYAYRYSLVVEGGSCEDGVLCQEYCPVCGEVLYEYTSTWHRTFTEEIATLTCTSSTYNGTVTVYCESCLCGYNSYIYYESNDGCRFNDYTVEEYLYSADGTTIIGEIDKYQCYYTGCQNYYLLKRYYCSTNGDSVYTYYQYNTETEDWSAVYTYTSTSEHHSTTYKYGSYTDSDGNSVSWSGYLCEYCDYGYKHIYKYDSNGYQIYYGYEYYDSDGTVTYSWYYKYNRDSSGSLINTEYYVNDEYRYTYTESTSYDSSTGLRTYIYNYTYADGSTRQTTEKYRSDSYDRYIYYYYEEMEDGELTYTNTYSYEFVDGGTCYALYSYEYCYYYSDGEVSKSSGSYYEYYHPYTSYYDNDNGTCTQTYTYGWYCPVCKTPTSTYTTINGHDWYYDSSLGVYVCGNCGLESENASSSEIVLEEFTYDSTYGKDGYLAVGYYYPYDSEDMIISYYLVPVDSQDNLDLTDDSYIKLDDILTVDDTGSIIYISLEDLKAIAAEKGVSLSDYDLRISFWYYYDNDVTSITLSDLLMESIAGNTYTFSSVVCIEDNENDETLIAAALEEVSSTVSCCYSFEFKTDGTAVMTICEGSSYSEGYYETIEGTYLQSGGKVICDWDDWYYFTLSDDGKTLTWYAFGYESYRVTLEIDLSYYTEDKLETENTVITAGIVYTLVAE